MNPFVSPTLDYFLKECVVELAVAFRSHSSRSELVQRFATYPEIVDGEHETVQRVLHASTAADETMHEIEKDSARELSQATEALVKDDRMLVPSVANVLLQLLELVRCCVLRKKPSNNIQILKRNQIKRRFVCG